MATSTSVSPAIKAPDANDSRWLETVERQVKALKFGSILISVHEGRVVQVETSVKVRFDRP